MKKIGHAKSEFTNVENKKSINSYLIKFVGFFLPIIGLLFIPAGRWDWWQAWLFVLVYAIFVVISLLRGLRKDPEQIIERSHIGKNVKSWDKIILGVYTVLLIIMLVVAGLDAGRFGWAPVSPAMEIVGWLGLILAGSLIWWTSSVNTFLSKYVRIQKERGQYAVTRGPYQWVRHPMYVGVILFVLSIPLILGSGWALVPAGLIVILFIIRTAMEDKTLKEELSGYREYAEKVRFRLIPGIW